MSIKAKSFVLLVAAAGLSVVAFSATQYGSTNLTRYLCYLTFAIFASCMKVNLPGITGTMSVNFLFILIGILELNLSETLLMGCVATIVQCFWHARVRPKPIQVLFNVANMATAIGVSHFSYRGLLAAKPSLPALVAAVAVVFFVMNTVPIAAIISLTEGKPLKKIWEDCYFWCFPYYLVGAAIAGSLSTLNLVIGWQGSLLILPVIYWIYRSYHLYLGRLESEKRHGEEMADLHLRTIEALALAIEAKDHTTHNHLRRVRTYSIELAKEMGLSRSELEALHAAALLHDIGKLAVPEHIISKPGKLTPEEFEKMKIHPVVGAEILEPVKFPYPVVPIVRAHHEKWDGSGYPYGLKAEEIPIGARILAVVDCLDALASHRQYRPALPLEEAMEKVISEAGKSFDPRVVEILQQRYSDLEQKAAAQKTEGSRLSREVKIERGEAPAAGFEQTDLTPEPPSNSADFLSSIAAARQEVHVLFELTHALGNSLSLDETLSVLGIWLKRMIPYDAIAIYLLQKDKLVPEYVSGENFRALSSLQVPMGQGLVGWVAQNVKPIVNGNPAIEGGYPVDQNHCPILHSGLAVPLKGVDGLVGVIALYLREKDAFTNDHLRILLAISPKVAMSIENALKYRQAENSATTDFLTGLPNARSLFLHLDSEVARCKRQNAPLSVLVCDLDGFKQVNDRLGHLEGNKALRLVAKGLRDVCREYDYAARLGGDEFVAVFPGLKRDAARAMSYRLRQVAAEVGRQIWGDDLLSLSVGEAYYPEDGSDADQLLAEADRRMYTFKQRRAHRYRRHQAYLGIAPTTTQ